MKFQPWRVLLGFVMVTVVMLYVFILRYWNHAGKMAPFDGDNLIVLFNRINFDLYVWFVLDLVRLRFKLNWLEPSVNNCSNHFQAYLLIELNATEVLI